MKNCVLLSLLLALGCMHVHGAPVEQDGLEQASCEDASVKGAAGLALTKINKDRKEGYIFALHRLFNAHMVKHGENGVVFYLTMNVVETNCSVLSRKDWKECEARPTSDTPVYGQCKAAIYISKVHRVVRLYKYDCAVRPVPAAKVGDLCPDCPSHIKPDDDQVQKLVSLSLEKFNKESNLKNRFALHIVSRATNGMAMSMYYNVEYTIQETTCKNTDAADSCPPMDCEFAHKGFCKASLFYTPTGEADVNVDCEIYEPEAADREKKNHLLGGATDHSHTDASADGVHAHNDKAHDHSGDSDNHHHVYTHADGTETHAHDHELALDHDHKHAHLHEHEHNHHHHEHEHEGVNHQPEGSVRVLTAMDQPMTLPAFPDVPVGDVGVTLPAKPDPQIPGVMEPTILSFPNAVSAQCPPSPAPADDATLVEKIFDEDAMFKSAA